MKATDSAIILGKKKVGRETRKWGGTKKSYNNSQECVYFGLNTVLSALYSLNSCKALRQTFCSVSHFVGLTHPRCRDEEVEDLGFKPRVHVL